MKNNILFLKMKRIVFLRNFSLINFYISIEIYFKSKNFVL